MQSLPAVVCGNLLLIPALFPQVGTPIRPESNGQLQEVEALHRARAPVEQTEKMPSPESASVPWRSLASEEGDDPTVPAANLTGHQPAPAARKLVQKAERLSKKGHREQAIAAFQKALALDPAYYEAENDLALELEAAGQAGAAEQALRHLSQTAPGHVLASANLAMLLCREHRYRDMEAVARQALKRHQYSLIANYLLGAALVDQGKWTNEAKIELQYAEVRYTEAKALLDKWPPRP